MRLWDTLYKIPIYVERGIFFEIEHLLRSESGHPTLYWMTFTLTSLGIWNPLYDWFYIPFKLKLHLYLLWIFFFLFLWIDRTNPAVILGMVLFRLWILTGNRLNLLQFDIIAYRSTSAIDDSRFFSDFVKWSEETLLDRIQIHLI